MTITEFLLARIAEDEEAARAVEVGALSLQERAGWGGECAEVRIAGALDDGRLFAMNSYGTPHLLAHIARHDPARVLAECEAKRRIVEIHKLEDYRGVPSCYLCAPEYSWGTEPDEGPCDTLLALAQPYADHLDFDPAWRE